MALADRMAATSLRLIKNYGKTLTITRITAPGTYDTATGKTSAPTTATVTAKAIVKDFDGRTYGSTVNLLLKVGDKQILIAASGLSKPSVADKFTIDGVTYTIVPVRDGGLEVETVFVQETPVLYKVHGRRT